MVLDTSAIIAILLGETSSDRLLAAIEGDHTRLVSAATVVESSLVMVGRFGDAGEALLDRLLQSLGTEVMPVTEEQVFLARDAGLRFGRSRHQAALNFGDCFPYALSVTQGEPLLFVGNDFAMTDVEVCRW